MTGGTVGLPRLEGRTAVVTGGTSGIGYFVTEQLAALGARVVVTARDPARARSALAAVAERVPGAEVSYLPMDLASLASVRSAAAQLAGLPRIDALVANAAVIGYPGRIGRGLNPPVTTTADGFELHLGTNHLGHFALVAALLPQLHRWGTRVVHVGSLSHRLVRPTFPADGRPTGESPFLAYSRSKLAVVLFGLELARRLAAAGSPAASVVAHPGTAVDVLTPARPGVAVNQPTAGPPLRTVLVRAALQGKDAAACTLVHAAVDAEVRNGDMWGPSCWLRTRGRPARERPHRRARDRRAAAEVVELSERLTGVRLAP